MTDISKLIKLRAGSKSACTKLRNSSDTVLGENDEVRMTCLQRRLSVSLGKVKEYDSKILELFDETQLEEEMMKQSEYEGLVEDEITKLEIAITKLKQSASKVVKPKEIKLPTLNLSTFDGDPRAWTGFWELFKCAVHDRKDLTDIQKFTYLRGQMEGHPLTLISGFSIEGASYDPAFKVLKETYGREDQIKAAHINSFYNLVTPAYEINELKQFHAAFECAIKSIITAGVTITEFCSVILAQKLPAPLRENIRCELKEKWLDLDEFTEAFLREMQTLEVSENVVSHERNPVASATFLVQHRNPKSYQSKQISRKESPEPYHVATNPKTCRLCNSPKHLWYKCDKYKDGYCKINRAKELNLCTGCISADHGRKGCNNPKVWPCITCQKKHYAVLCPSNRQDHRIVKGESKESKETSTTLTALSGKTTVVLPTIQIPMYTKDNKVLKSRALLDQCSQRSFVSRSYLDRFKYRVIGQAQLQLQGFTGSSERRGYEVVALKFQHKARKRTLNAVVIDQLPTYKSPVGLESIHGWLVRKGYRLADPFITDNGGISLLIGADHYYDVVHSGYIREEGIVLLPTIYGYAISGQFEGPESDPNVEVVTILKVATHPVEMHFDNSEVETLHPELKDLNALWELDHVGIKSDEMSNRSKGIMRQFEEMVEYSSEENRYTVNLPWNEKKQLLPTNFKLAMGRLRGLQKNFLKDPAYCEQYSKVIQEQEIRGFIERVEITERSGNPCHYLAHKGVKKESVTTPVRVVYDCSAKNCPQALSLNDCLHTGPTLVTDLTEILLRFRLHRYAWVSDIEKAYLMVKLADEDQDSTRFLWPKDPLNLDSDFIVYRFKVVLFGATCSQFLLNATIKRHLENSKEQQGIRALQRGLYIDNLQGTGDSYRVVKEQSELAITTFAQAHLHLREWLSNSVSLQRDFKLKGIAAVDQTRVKTMGVYWETERDLLAIQIKSHEKKVLTKREALSITASVFYPLGIVLPVTIKARLFIQQLWKVQCSWDEEIPEEKQREWKSIYKEIQGCLQVRIPRQVCDGEKTQLHVFSDASTKAYGAAAYFCGNSKGELVIAKAKVAPLKTLTVPKLELTAVVLAARLAKFVKEAYKEELTITETYLWCDSQIAIAWLSSKKELTAYVQNRVDEIKGLVPDAQLHYIITEDNPSDLLTRGIAVSTLIQSSLWWKEPSWLPHRSSWPEMTKIPEELVIEQVVVSAGIAPSSIEIGPTLFNWERFSNFGRMVRVMAWTLRFVTKCRNYDNVTTSYLQVPELRVAERKVITLVQEEGFPIEYKLLNSSEKHKPTPLMYQLGLYKEGDVIRCRSRLQKALIDDQTKNPILLPKKHKVTEMLVEYTHKMCQHYGVGFVVAYLRHKYWIPQMRQIVKWVQSRCITCKKLQGKKYTEVPDPPLPDIRVQQLAPFQVTGIDYTGAISIKDEKNVLGKTYIVLFTCAVTRAIHLELVNNMSCESFLHAFRRFCSRRGFPQLLISDNATTFKSGSKVLLDLVKDEKVINNLSEINCEWRFIPARAPWYGAIWERCIGIVKSGLKKVLGRALVTREELNTILLELEAAVNDRPLGYVSGDLNEPLPITPAQLLYGRQLRPFPGHVVDLEELNDPTLFDKTHMTRRLQYVSKLSKDLWKRWAQEYLLSLRETNKGKLARSSNTWPSVGDVVLIHDEGPRLFWRLGIVTKLSRGQDQHCRVVEVRTDKGTTIRSIRTLYPLEIDVGDNDSIEQVEDAATIPGKGDLDIEGSIVKSRPARPAALQSSQLWRTLAQEGKI